MSLPGSQCDAATVSLSEAFRYWLKLGFISFGGPLVESTRNNIRLTAPLTAISAAVVGVIASLALFFASHVFRVAAPAPHWDLAAIGITLAACIALFRFKVGTIKLIFGCALSGLVLSYS